MIYKIPFLHLEVQGFATQVSLITASLGTKVLDTLYLKQQGDTVLPMTTSLEVQGKVLIIEHHWAHLEEEGLNGLSQKQVCLD